MNSGIYGYLHSRGFIPGLPGVLAPDLSAGGVIRTPGGMTPSAVAPPIPQGVAPLQAAGPPQYAPGGFLRGVDRVLGGPPMAGLTPQNATEARRLGLLNAGIGMLAGASHGNFADALVGGLSGGQAGYQQGIQQGYGKQEDEARRQMFAAMAPSPNESDADRLARLHSMFSYVAGNPGPNQAAMLSSLSGEIDSIQNSMNRRGPAGDRMNLDTPKMMLVNGKPTLAAFDGATNRWFGTDGKQLSGDIRTVPTPDRATTAGKRGLTSTQAKAQGFIPSVDSDVSQINRTLQTIDPGGKWLASAGSGNFAQLLRANSPDAQMLANSAGTLAEAWLRMTTGAAYNEQEYTNAVNRFLIRPTDAPTAVQWKLKNMKMLQSMLREIAGSASVPDATDGADFTALDAMSEGR